jgi:hypothetical protein
MFAEMFRDTPVLTRQEIYNIINDVSTMEACMISRGLEDLELH